jgi:hypothetical protein
MLVSCFKFLWHQGLAFIGHNMAMPPPSIYESLRNIRREQQNPASERLSNRTPQTRHNPQQDYASLDIGIEEEESHYINLQAFAELTLEDVKERGRSRDEATYRQVSSNHKNPTFFIRNPSLIYGLTQAGGAVFFQRACEIVGYEWPPRLLPLYVPSLSVASSASYSFSRLQVLAKNGGCFPYRGFSTAANIPYGPIANTFGALCLVCCHPRAYDNLHLGDSATSQAIMGSGIACDGR